MNEESLKTWNKIADVYEQKFMPLTIYDHTYDWFCEAIPDCASVLDIGCGPGNISKYLLDKKPGLNLWGIDMAPNMIALAKKNNPGGKFQVMDCKDVKSIASKFDGIVCGFVIPYVSNAEISQFMSDVSDLLIYGGVLYLSFVDGSPDDSGMISNGQGDRTIFHYHRESELIRLLQCNRLTVDKVFYIDYPKGDSVQIHTVLIAKKSTT